MTHKHEALREARASYWFARAKKIVRYLWSRAAVFVAIQAIVILYALLRFLLKKNQVE
jgi:phage shock protein PspC (stress-responsive transcriptional regulator)